MAKTPNQSPSPNPLNKTLVKVLALTIFCSLFYLLGSYYSSSNSVPQIPPFHQSLCTPQFNLTTTKTNSWVSLDFEPHHGTSTPEIPSLDSQIFEFCDKNFTDYCPCQDPSREKGFDAYKRFDKERHCPKEHEVVRCLVPRPVGYRTPFRWPESRKFAWFSNVPYKSLVSYKKSQNWIRLEGDRFVFPGGGTSFRNGVKDYINGIKKVVPLKSGNVRTVLDVGCGVASFGAALMDDNILTMSIAPRDIHEAQVQFTLERGLPAILGVLSTHRLPFPSRSFDMVHCSRCLVPWSDFDGLYLIEIDRFLRPGGYWVLSGPPIGWKDKYREQVSLEELAKRLCWKKIAEQDPVAVWRKPTNHVHCTQKSKILKSPRFCDDTDPDAGWYKKMEPCITPLPKVKNIKDISGGTLEKWPKRLNTVPPRLKSKDTSVKAFYQDNQLWIRRISRYVNILKPVSLGTYRNIMDMNAGLGGFAAALSKYPVWVMNVIPSHVNNTLGVIYERGLIGTYTNWCEAFSTYPRTYDLIHANGVFSMYMDKCDILDILFEMHRILRPKGIAIIRDHVDVIVKVKSITDRMKWNSKIQHSEGKAHHPEKILLVDDSDR